MRLQKITLRYIPVSVTVEQVSEAIGEAVRRHIILLDRIVSRKRPGVPQTSTFVIHFSNADAAESFLNNFVPAKELDVPDAVIVPAPWQRIVRVTPDPFDKKENTYTTDPIWLHFNTQQQVLQQQQQQQPQQQQVIKGQEDSAVEKPNKAVDLSPLVAELVARQSSKGRSSGRSNNKKLLRRTRKEATNKPLDNEKRKLKKRHRFHHREAQLLTTEENEQQRQVFFLKRQEEQEEKQHPTSNHSPTEQRYKNYYYGGRRGRNRRQRLTFVPSR